MKSIMLIIKHSKKKLEIKFLNNKKELFDIIENEDINLNNCKYYNIEDIKDRLLVLKRLRKLILKKDIKEDHFDLIKILFEFANYKKELIDKDFKYNNVYELINFIKNIKREV